MMNKDKNMTYIHLLKSVGRISPRGTIIRPLVYWPDDSQPPTNPTVISMEMLTDLIVCRSYIGVSVSVLLL